MFLIKVIFFVLQININCTNACIHIRDYYQIDTCMYIYAFVCMLSSIQKMMLRKTNNIINMTNMCSCDNVIY